MNLPPYLIYNFAYIVNNCRSNQPSRYVRSEGDLWFERDIPFPGLALKCWQSLNTHSLLPDSPIPSAI